MEIRIVRSLQYKCKPRQLKNTGKEQNIRPRQDTMGEKEGEEVSGKVVSMK